MPGRSRKVEESVIVEKGGVELRVPAYPSPCSYVRVTRRGHEVIYWDEKEWQENPAEVMGAIMGTAREILAGGSLSFEEALQREV